MAGNDRPATRETVRRGGSRHDDAGSQWARVIAFLVTSEDSVPVIICSAAGLTALAGYDPTVVKAIVRKPFDIDQLVAAVTAVAHSAE